MNRTARIGSSERCTGYARLPLTVPRSDNVVARINQQPDDRGMTFFTNNGFLEAAIVNLHRSDAKGSHGKK